MSIDILWNAIRKSVETDTQEELSRTKIFTLGKLIAKLENVDKEKLIIFDDGDFPSELISYRGIYRFLSITSSTSARTAGDFLRQLENVVDKELEGYKGGQYRMTESVFVFVSEYGRSSQDGVTGIRESDEVILEVSYVGTDD